MKYKIVILFQIILILFLTTGFLLHKKDNPQIATETLKYTNDNLIRVGISTNDFSQLKYDKASFSSAGKFNLIDKSTGTVIANSPGKDIFTVSINDETLTVYNSEKIIAKDLIGPVCIKSEEGFPVQIIGLTEEESKLLIGVKLKF